LPCKRPPIDPSDVTSADESTDAQIRSLVFDALSGDTGLRPLKGFRLDLSANRGFRKLFYSARCDCGTAALLSVEVARDKTLEQVREALPELTRRLEMQANSFRKMSCEAHRSMRMGPAAAPMGRPGE
jgi:hypothetical protein